MLSQSNAKITCDTCSFSIVQLNPIMILCPEEKGMI